MKVHFKISEFLKHAIMTMTVLVLTYRQLIVFLQNARPLLMAAPPHFVNHQRVPQQEDPLPLHQPLVPQPAEPEDPLPPRQPPQPLRRSRRVRRAPQRLTL